VNGAAVAVAVRGIAVERGGLPGWGPIVASLRTGSRVDLRQDHKTREASTLFSRTPAWRKGETPPVAFAPDTQLAKAVLYGKLLHTDPDHRRWLATFGGPGQAEDEHQAVMRLCHNTGRTALQIDEIIRLAVDSNTLLL
jgi:hypothetical protein